MHRMAIIDDQGSFPGHLGTKNDQSNKTKAKTARLAHLVSSEFPTALVPGSQPARHPCEHRGPPALGVSCPRPHCLVMRGSQFALNYASLGERKPAVFKLRLFDFIVTMMFRSNQPGMDETAWCLVVSASQHLVNKGGRAVMRAASLRRSVAVDDTKVRSIQGIRQSISLWRNPCNRVALFEKPGTSFCAARVFRLCGALHSTLLDGNAFPWMSQEEDAGNGRQRRDRTTRDKHDPDKDKPRRTWPISSSHVNDALRTPFLFPYSALLFPIYTLVRAPESWSLGR